MTILLRCIHLEELYNGGNSDSNSKHLIFLSLQRPAECAYTTLYVATSPRVEGLGGRYYDNCQEVQSSEESYNQEVQRRLWDISCEMTQISH